LSDVERSARALSDLALISVDNSIGAKGANIEGRSGCATGANPNARSASREKKSVI
jgi:hypothetical protein